MIIIIGVGELFGAILGIIGFVMLLAMSASSNYTDVGIAMGIAILGIIVFLISLILIITRLKVAIKNSDKKGKIISLMYLAILIISAIIGYCVPAYSNSLKIEYSNIVSIFVKPIIVYIIIMIINLFKAGWIENIGDSIFHFVMLTIGLGIFVFAGIGIMGINYFLGNTDFLEWADKNFSYENRIMIEQKKSKYGTDDFKTILEIDLKNAKEYYFETKKYDTDTVKNNFLKHPYGFLFELDDYQELENNIYICTFIDKSQYGEDGEFPRYYAKIDLTTLSLIEILDNQAASNNAEENEFIEKLEKEKEVEAKDALKYAIINLKNKQKDITKENINEQLKYLKDTGITCKEVINQNEENYLITMHTKREKFMSNPTYKDEKFTVDKNTYKVSDYFDFE